MSLERNWALKPQKGIFLVVSHLNSMKSLELGGPQPIIWDGDHSLGDTVADFTLAAQGEKSLYGRSNPDLVWTFPNELSCLFQDKFDDSSQRPIYSFDVTIPMRQCPLL
ncbi:hypothetical protein HNY73_004050 [Argiope bruennichi]|uniref:Uncharacterized protein n=1 Tax=Argiope bruennichi TaxID=94029 RepID=A0A8T0FQK1_ARGBR|nr:hypothetical protein HNY73_004050 [Argiope bruennichi]